MGCIHFRAIVLTVELMDVYSAENMKKHIGDTALTGDKVFIL